MYVVSLQAGSIWKWQTNTFDCLLVEGGVAEFLGTLELDFRRAATINSLKTSLPTVLVLLRVWFGLTKDSWEDPTAHPQSHSKAATHCMV